MKSPGVSKGLFVSTMLKQPSRFGVLDVPDCIICAGDDVTDDSMMIALDSIVIDMASSDPNGATQDLLPVQLFKIKVGSRPIPFHAQYIVPTVLDMHALLEDVANIVAARNEKSAEH